MRRSLIALPLLFAWVALCLPWQICQSDCRTVLVGGWQHACHLPEAHDGCGCECHHDHGDCTGDSRCEDHRGGSHARLQIPLTQPPETGPGFHPPAPPCHDACIPPDLEGLPKRILARCTGPPGSRANTLPRLRSVVLLL